MSEERLTSLAVPEPTLDLDAAIRQHMLYLEACKRLLSDEDYAVIKGRKFRKRSGWAKLRKAFTVSTSVVEERFVEYPETWGYCFIVRATLPNGRWEDSDGLVTYEELEKERIKAAVRKNNGQSLNPEQLQEIRDGITRQDVRGKALTRAKSRATSDILGAGVVSAEEKATQHEHWIDNLTIRKRFWEFAKGTLKLSEEQVHEALKVESVKDFQGTMSEAKAVLESYAMDNGDSS